MRAALLILAGATAVAGADSWDDLFPGRAPAKPAVVSPAAGAGASPVRPVERGEADLGRRLFSDPILSEKGGVSCTTCHDPAAGFTSRGLPSSLNGTPLTRRAPSVLNSGNRTAFFWDGRAKTLEEQALGPVFNPSEMGSTRSSLGARITTADRYPEFKGLTLDAAVEKVAKALAAYERTLVTPTTRHDAYLAGERKALSPAEEKGWSLFKGKALCYKCHAGPDLTDDGFHATGHPAGPGGSDPGRGGVTKDKRDRGKFKTPPLRNCKAAAPYMHDAGLKTLADVVEFYDKGGVAKPGGEPAPNVSPWVRPLGLTPEEKRDLVALLEAL